MSTSVRFTKILTAVAMTASIAACNDLSSSPKKATSRTGRHDGAAQADRGAGPSAADAADAAHRGDRDGQAAGRRRERRRRAAPAPTRWPRRASCSTTSSYDKALKLASIAVKRMPKRSGAWNTLGRVQLQMGKRKDAIESFEKAVDLNPKNSYARNNLGLALIYDKRFEEAADTLEQAVELEPVEAYMWNNLGMAYEQLDRLEDARVAYGNAVEMESDLARKAWPASKGVKSVIRTAKVDTENKDGTVAPTVIRE